MRREAEDAGAVMCGHTAWRLCSAHGLWFDHAKKRGTNGKRSSTPAVKLALLTAPIRVSIRHGFVSVARGVNQVRVTGITEHPTDEGTLCVYTVKDVRSNRIVGYEDAPGMCSALAISALNTAVTRRRINGYDMTSCIVHSDRRSQFRSNQYLQALKNRQYGGVSVDSATELKNV